MNSARLHRRWRGGILLAVLLTSFALVASGAETNALSAGGVPPLPVGAVILLETNTVNGLSTSAAPFRAASMVADEQALRSYLEVQAKLHSTLLAIEQARQEAGAASASNATLLAERLHQLESALAAQRAREREAADQSNRTLLIAAGGFAGLGVLALGLMIFYQMRGMTRLAEIATALPAGRVLTTAHGLPALGPGDSALALTAGSYATAEADSARLLGVIERLERRIHELEQTAQGNDESRAASGGNIGNQKSGGVAKLLERAKTFEREKRHAEAMACCDEALAKDPALTQAWLIKAAQLQALGREKEAIRCYESALRRVDAGERAAV